jgi:hypothetical protein
MFRSLMRLALFVCIPVAPVVACGDSVILGQDQPPPPEEFAAVDAGPEASTILLTDYCASSKCSTGYTTCPGSKFPCDVDLRSDRNNCGACGAPCPEPSDSEVFDCIEGRCALRCTPMHQDCDGLIDNGCEAEVTTNSNCGTCGNKCTETAPCLRELSDTPACGCPDPYTYCASDDISEKKCRMLKKDDEHCGACGVVCDPAGIPGGDPVPPNAYFGCGGGECGQPKCRSGYADCNNDLGKPGSDGCEVRLGTHDNCTTCGDSCVANGMFCVNDLPFKGIACRCPPGQNFCGATSIVPFIGTCANFTSDETNCGGCGRICPGTTTRSKGVCEYGTCKLQCGERWADCNGNVDDDCEVDVFSDPRNCGGCGIGCDIAAGQACAGGRCVVEPCTGEVAR